MLDTRKYLYGESSFPPYAQLYIYMYRTDHISRVRRYHQNQPQTFDYRQIMINK